MTTLHRNAADSLDALIARRLRARREAAGLSAEALGARLGLPAQRIEDFEAARAPVPLFTLARLSEALGVRLAAFFVGTGGKSG